MNVGQGAMKSVEAAGGCLSPLLGGSLASRFGYPNAFIALGSLAFIAGSVDHPRRDELDKMADVDTSALFS
ncbi:hypothetical protein [Paraburkholderia sprentiae]|uniref:hypothetical protein n=1 Tax=Paraburkholderia sprentiae TaxID=948107 RepID=UPI00041CE018|nr:hypothetical protein [Paraburkholderia sprentiae]